MKTLELTRKEFNTVNKVLLLAGHKDASYAIIKSGMNNGSFITIPDLDEATFDLIVKLLIIDEDPDTQRLGYNLVNENA